MLVDSTTHCLMFLCQIHVMMSLSLGLSVGSSRVSRLRGEHLQQALSPMPALGRYWNCRRPLP